MTHDEYFELYMVDLDPAEWEPCPCPACFRSRAAVEHRQARHILEVVSGCEWCAAEHADYLARRRGLDWAASLTASGRTGRELWRRWMLARLTDG